MLERSLCENDYSMSVYPHFQLQEKTLSNLSYDMGSFRVDRKKT